MSVASNCCCCEKCQVRVVVVGNWTCVETQPRVLLLCLIFFFLKATLSWLLVGMKVCLCVSEQSVGVWEHGTKYFLKGSGGATGRWPHETVMATARNSSLSGMKHILCIEIYSHSQHSIGRVVQWMVESTSSHLRNVLVIHLVRESIFSLGTIVFWPVYLLKSGPHGSLLSSLMPR